MGGAGGKEGEKRESGRKKEDEYVRIRDKQRKRGEREWKERET